MQIPPTLQRKLHGKSSMEIERLSNLMETLFPQILFFLETGFVASNGINASDQKFCLQSIKEHMALFGETPKTFGFDRGGYSKANLKKAKKLGVKNVGIAPTGKAPWSVSEKMSEVIRRERAQVEGVIGSLKSKKYGFNKPNVKSTVAMEMSGHRSRLGFNLCKALRKLNEQQLQVV